MASTFPKQTTVTAEMTCGLGALFISHPPGTFALTPASLISLRAIGANQQLLHGTGLDWGSGSGCLAIAAAKVQGVRHVVGLEISETNVDVARQNAARNNVADKVTFLLSDSYMPRHRADRESLSCLVDKVDFLLANPPSSENDDGFGFRRIVLRGAGEYLVEGGVVFLSISSQYGSVRWQRLCQEVPGFSHGGVLASTDWVPFDLNRADLLHCLNLYAEEERRGGLEYTFRNPRSRCEEPMSAQAALAYHESTGHSPLTKWQTHLFVFKPASST